MRVREGDELPDGSTVIVHLGAGAHDNLVDKAIGSYEEYRSVSGDGFGRFVFRVCSGPRA